MSKSPQQMMNERLYGAHNAYQVNSRKLQEAEDDVTSPVVQRKMAMAIANNLKANGWGVDEAWEFAFKFIERIPGPKKAAIQKIAMSIKQSSGVWKTLAGLDKKKIAMIATLAAAGISAGYAGIRLGKYIYNKIKGKFKRESQETDQLIMSLYECLKGENTSAKK